MTKLLIAGLALIFSAQAFAGASNTGIECTNKDGAITLSGSVPGDFAEFTLSVNQGKGDKKKEFMKLFSVTNQQTAQTEENARIVVIEDIKNNVYALQATDIDGFQNIRLYAIPKSLKVKKGKSENREIKTSFDGKLSVDSENGLIETDVTCQTEYSI